MARGIVIAAPQSGSGKTLVTLAIIRALRDQGYKVASAKVGPDYIDPRFHEAASGRPCFNLDLWAMGAGVSAGLLSHIGEGMDFVIVEGVMGLFDGPAEGKGSTADVAVALGLPVVLVVDASHQAQSVAALVHGFDSFAPPGLAGVILNKIKSARHEKMTRKYAVNRLTFDGNKLKYEVCCMPHNANLNLPSRHLGLVQAEEIQGLEAIISDAARSVSHETKILDLIDRLSVEIPSATWKTPLPPPGQRIEIARDIAFNFIYPHLIEGWRRAGADITFFSPLSDEAPRKTADFIFLPGGYPELHAEKLSNNFKFLNGLKSHPAQIYGECGGYMVLGETLTDASGKSHKMAGLLPVRTSFAKRKLHLGYRTLKPLSGPWKRPILGHEFHYSSLEYQGLGAKFFEGFGVRVNNVFGSYAHIISEAP
jgi:cobyrinic acid a,c-diamide synthase